MAAARNASRRSNRLRKDCSKAGLRAVASGSVMGSKATAVSLTQVTIAHGHLPLPQASWWMRIGCAIVSVMHSSATLTFGTQIREWRQRRRLSQLDLSVDADVSTRHLSFVETGRAMPSREMVLRLADRLEVPLREPNRWLTAARFPALHAARTRDASPVS